MSFHPKNLIDFSPMRKTWTDRGLLGIACSRGQVEPDGAGGEGEVHFRIRAFSGAGQCARMGIRAVRTTKVGERYGREFGAVNDGVKGRITEKRVQAAIIGKAGTECSIEPDGIVTVGM